MFGESINPSAVNELTGTRRRRIRVARVRVAPTFRPYDPINETHFLPQENAPRMRPIIWICIAVFAAAMAFVDYGAHQIVGNFGIAGGLVAIAAMYGAARYFERERR
jgi:hypothetical protein